MSEVTIYIEGTLVTQFDNESINFKSTVQDINDISKIFADFSKDFNVPADKVNNKLFKHYYDADITGGFDARTKKDAEIYLNDLLYSKGSIRLTGASLKDNVIDSYKIQFEGDTIKIKDLLGDDKLSDLNLSAYNHIYSSANIKTGLTSSLSSGNVIYPTISPVRRFVYDSSDTIVSDATITNIHYNASKQSNSIDFKDLKPALKVNAIIDAIQSDYGLNFVGGIFQRDYIDNLFLWLNKDEGYLKAVSNSVTNLINWDGGDTDHVNLATDTLTIPALGGFGSDFVFDLSIYVDAAYTDTLYNLVATKNGIEFFRKDNIKNDYTKTFIANSLFGVFVESDEIKFYIESNESFSYDARLGQIDYNGAAVNLTTTASLSLIEGLVDISYQMPDIKIYDFLVGIVKMFNITLTGNTDGSINWETLPDWYRLGATHKNFEKYIDVESLDIKRGVLKNEFKFKYEKPETLLAKQFADNNGISYGDLEAKLYDNSGKLLDGGKLEIKVPFENMIYERLLDSVDNSEVDFQYGLATDKELSPVVTKPILFYNINTPVNGVGFRQSDLSLDELNTNINTPNHCVSLTENTAQTLNFGAEISTYNYGLMEQSLYNSFYKDYVTDMFSNQRRIYTFDAIIPAHVLTSIKLNDRLIISNRRYIINSINSNLVTKKTKLELLNDIYTSGDLIGDSFYVQPSAMSVSKDLGNYTADVYSANPITSVVTDLGYGEFAKLLSAKTTTSGGVNTLQLQVDPNNTGLERYIKVVISQSGYTDIELIIRQTSGAIEWSNNVITFDNNIITFDSN